MKTLQIDVVKAKVLYPNANDVLKSMLEDTFGKEVLSVNITDRIKSYEDACLCLELNPDELPDVSNCDKKDRKSIIAYHKLIIICRALNEGWEPNWRSATYKYFPWFGTYAGFAYSSAANAPSSAYATFGSRLCFKSEDLSRYAGMQFLDIWKDYIMIE